MRVHPRVSERHPEITEADVEFAWVHCAAVAVREVGVKEVRVGFDAQGREIEMVGVLAEDGWIVYHALTPPTKKLLREIDAAARRR